MKIAINSNYTNKLNGDAPRMMWRTFNGSFKNVDIAPRMFAAHIRLGHAYTAQHDGYRKAQNFLYGQHLATDHDTDDHRSSFEYLLQDEFIKQFAYLLHTTPSHTEKTPRARVVYILDKPIRNKDGYSELAQSLCYRFNEADQSAKDPARFFFGHNNGKVKMLGNVLPVHLAAEILVAPYLKFVQEDRERRQQALENAVCVPVTNTGAKKAVLDKQLHRIAVAPDGTKYDTLLAISRTLGGYVASGYYTYNEVKNELANAILSRNIESQRIAMGAINAGLQYGMREPLVIEAISQESYIGLDLS
jgi:hypothetical protein